jgi:hypothetical protein
MMLSRGMGDISPAKIKTIKKRDGNEPVKVYKKGGEVWDKPRPKGLGKPSKLSPEKKSAAKAAAKAAGRPYPNLIDNMRAARR